MTLTLENTVEELKSYDKKDVLAVSALEGQVLFDLVKANDPKVILEVGTGHGYSTMWMSLAMSKGAVLYTLDSIVRPHLFDQPQFRNGKIIRFIEGQLDERYDQIPEDIDLAFLDSQHQLDDIVYDIESVNPNLKEGGLIVIHDTVYRPDMGKNLADYFARIESHALKLADIKPSSTRWSFVNVETEYGLGIATKMGKGKS